MLSLFPIFPEYNFFKQASKQEAVEAMEEEVDVEEILTEDQMEQKDNPWAEGIEAGPRDSEELF